MVVFLFGCARVSSHGNINAHSSHAHSTAQSGGALWIGSNVSTVSMLDSRFESNRAKVRIRWRLVSVRRSDTCVFIT